MGNPEFVISNEIHDIIKNLKNQREDLFWYVIPDVIECALRVDKEAPDSQKKILKIEGIRGQKTILTDKKYLIYGYQDLWDSCSPEQKIALVANMLKRIDYPSPEELEALAKKGDTYEMGKIRKPDIEDFSSFIKTLGADWDKYGSQIPNLIESKEVDV